MNHSDRAQDLYDRVTSDEFCTIHLGLPLPMDVFGPLTVAIGALWPDAQFVSSEEHVPKRPMTTTISVRRGTPAVDPASLGPAEDPEAGDGTSSVVTAMEGGGIGVITGGDAVKAMGAGLMAFLDEHPDAINYVEQHLIWPGGALADQHLLVIIMRKDGKTPHELRQEAERERDRALRRVEHLERTVLELEGHLEADEPVGLKEIAERLGVKRGTVDAWGPGQRDTLPEPTWTIGGRPAWRWSVIEAWAREQGKL